MIPLSKINDYKDYIEFLKVRTCVEQSKRELLATVLGGVTKVLAKLSLFLAVELHGVICLDSGD